MEHKKTLVQRLRAKDETALEDIMSQYTRLVTSVIYNIGKNILTREDIEETAMDTFLTLWRNSDKVKEEALQGYICCIAKTKTFDKIDKLKNKAVNLPEEQDIEDPFSLESVIEDKISAETIESIIEAISQPDKDIVIRYYYYHQTTAEISKAMDINRQTVKTKLAKARKTIRDDLMKRGYDL